MAKTTHRATQLRLRPRLNGPENVFSWRKRRFSGLNVGLKIAVKLQMGREHPVRCSRSFWRSRALQKLSGRSDVRLNCESRIATPISMERTAWKASKGLGKLFQAVRQLFRQSPKPEAAKACASGLGCNGHISGFWSICACRHLDACKHRFPLVLATTALLGLCHATVVARAKT